MVCQRVKNLPPSGIREFFDLVLGMPDVVSLGVGEPDFITPWRVREKAITALEEGYTSYTSNKGLLELREATVEHLKRKYFLHYDPHKEILITVGVSEALDLALRAILEAQDKVIVVAPYYVAYPALVELNGGEVLYLETRFEDKFKIDLEKLDSLLQHSPKAIILNYPSNPTGITYNREDLEELWAHLSKQDIFIISDEIYDELSYEGEHIPFACLEGAKKRVLLLNGFSKGYAMTGFRIGYACGDEEIIEAMTKIHSFSMLCAPIVSQIAACDALKAQEEVSSMRREYKRRREFIVEELNRIGLPTHLPQGAFYCFSSIKKYGLNSLDFAKRLLLEKKVAIVPGKAFGANYDDFIRISYASSWENLKEAVVRIEEFLESI